jgi:hypothetical protein
LAAKPDINGPLSRQTALDSISAADLLRHVEFLADDAREGRPAGSRGNREAGDYVAARFHDCQLPPGGDGGYFQPFAPGYRNVLAVLRGSDPRRQNETIVISAHYDHVGYGSRRTSRGPVGYIHNGADDNASGVAGLLELAEAFTLLPQSPGRTMVFAAWDAEEIGMFGSKHWIAQPTVDREGIVFLLNLDMIGRLRENRLRVLGSRSGEGLRRFLTQRNRDFEFSFLWTTKPNADHWPFFDANIPILTFNTGLTDEYHTPADDADLINSEGMRQVVRLAFECARDLANAEVVPQFRATAREETDEISQRRFAPIATSQWQRVQWNEPKTPEKGVVFADGASAAQLPANPPRLGVSWRVDPAEPGTVVLVRVAPGSPAEHAGLAPGDRIYQVAGEDFVDDAQFAQRVKALPGPITLLVEREGKLRTVVVDFDPTPAKPRASASRLSSP